MRLQLQERNPGKERARQDNLLQALEEVDPNHATPTTSMQYQQTFIHSKDVRSTSEIRPSEKFVLNKQE